MRKERNVDVYLDLRESITELRRLPGEELSIEALCEEYGVSRSPVRDALLRLSRDKLVDIFPQKGTRVSFLDTDIVKEERFMRKCMELGALRKCLEKKRTEKEREAFVVRLESNLLVQRASLLEDDYPSFYKADDELHRLFYIEAELENVWAIIDAHTGNDKRIRMISYKDQEILGAVEKEHIDIVNAIKNKDTDLVLKLDEEHLEKVKQELDEFKEQFPSYFIK